MQLTKQTDFAFRVLIYLATQQQAKKYDLTQIQQIAEFYGISKNHLMKVVQKLSAKSYIIAKRGHQGGLKLGKDPSHIHVREIIELVEHTLDPVSCSQPSSVCLFKSDCRLKKHLLIAQEQFLSYLSTVTLQDLLNEHTHQIIFNLKPAEIAYVETIKNLT